MPTTSKSGCRIYNRAGVIERPPVTTIRRRSEIDGMPTIAGLVPLTDIMTRDVICARRDLEIEAVIDLVIHHYIGCIPVVDDDGSPVGMITKRDLVEHLAKVDPSPRTAEDVMLPLALTLDDRATVGRASAIMALEDVHHIPVVGSNGTVIGIVSSLDIVRWLARNDGFVTSNRPSS